MLLVRSWYYCYAPFVQVPYAPLVFYSSVFTVVPSKDAICTSVWSWHCLVVVTSHIVPVRRGASVVCII